MADVPHIIITLINDNDGKYTFQFSVKFKDSPVQEMTFLEPCSIDLDDLVKLREEDRYYISGGAHSTWILSCENGVYTIKYCIAAGGDDAYVVLELPQKQTIWMLTVWHDLIYARNTVDCPEFIKWAQQLNCEVV